MLLLLLFWRLHLLSRWSSPTVSVPPHQAIMELATGIDTTCDHRSSSSPSTINILIAILQLKWMRGSRGNGQWDLCFLLWGLLCFQVSIICETKSLYPIISNLYYINPPLSIACGATMNQNNSYAIISSYSTRFTITVYLYLRSLTRRSQRHNHIHIYIQS